jgi:N-acetylglucosaminyl-diphospho-decaprenol L-rhamnosyltransferase
VNRMQNHVAIAIVSFRSSYDIVECLAALSSLDHTNVSIYICENGGEAAFKELIGAIKSIADGCIAENALAGIDLFWKGKLPSGQSIRLILSDTNSGYAGGVNRCFAVAVEENWDLAWILNPDARPTPDSLRHMIAHMEVGRYGAVGAKLVFSATHRIQLYGGRWRRLLARGYNIGLNSPMDATPDVDAVETQMDYVHGACLLATRGFVDAVGPMDDRYFLYCEEVDWCLRGRSFRLGYANNAVVFHAHGNAIGSSIDRKTRSRLAVYLDERNRLLLSRRWFPLLYPLIVPLALLFTIQYLRYGAFKNFRHAVSGWWAGVRGETGHPAWMDPSRTG